MDSYKFDKAACIEIMFVDLRKLADTLGKLGLVDFGDPVYDFAIGFSELAERSYDPEMSWYNINQVPKEGTQTHAITKELL